MVVWNWIDVDLNTGFNSSLYSSKTLFLYEYVKVNAPVNSLFFHSIAKIFGGNISADRKGIY